MRRALRLLLFGKHPALPYGDGFDRADGALGRTWSGATWTISSNKAINTPTLGSELIVNGAFASDTVWTKGTDWSITGGAGVRAAGATPNTVISQAVLTTGVWYRAVFEVIACVAGSFRPYYNAGYANANLGAPGTSTSSNRATGTAAGVIAVSAGTDGSVDNASFKALTLSQLFATLDGKQANPLDIAVAITAHATQAHPAGLVLNLDSASVPANFVLATVDRTGAIKLIKCVAGTYTDVATGSQSYAAGGQLRVTKSSTSYTVYYNGVEAIAAQTISDAGIVSNTLHGMFSTHESNLLDNFVLEGA